MGSALSRYVHGYMSRHERRLLLLGLDNAGKTTVLKKVSARGGSSDAGTTPTTEFEVRSFHHGRVTINLWDVGGQDKLRPYWRHYYTGTQGVIYVIDASDRARLDTAAAELRNVAMDDQLAEAAICVLANKTDLPGALSAEDLKTRLDLRNTLAGHAWTVVSTVATRGDGLDACFDFLAANTKAL